jgi:hypothetical protein
MREHVRKLITHARNGKDAGRAACDLECLAADAIRCAHLAVAIHRAESVRSMATAAHRGAVARLGHTSTPQEATG